SLMPVSLVNRWPISASFLSDAGAKLFQQRYEISRCCPLAGGMPVARMPASPAVVVRKRRRFMASMGSFSSSAVVPSVGLPAEWRHWDVSVKAWIVGGHGVIGVYGSPWPSVKLCYDAERQRRHFPVIRSPRLGDEQ